MIAKKKTVEGQKTVCENRKAYHDYFFEEFYEAGLVLTGSEVKSLREGKAQLRDCYARLMNGEFFLINVHISPYDKSSYFGHEATRTRKLLLHKQQIFKLTGKIEQRGYTLVPTKIYFTHGIAKVELGLAKGKKAPDKRHKIREEELRREAERAIKQYK